MLQWSLSKVSIHNNFWQILYYYTQFFKLSQCIWKRKKTLCVHNYAGTNYLFQIMFILQLICNYHRYHPNNFLYRLTIRNYGLGYNRRVFENWVNTNFLLKESINKNQEQAMAPNCIQSLGNCSLTNTHGTYKVETMLTFWSVYKEGGGSLDLFPQCSRVTECQGS